MIKGAVGLEGQGNEYNTVEQDLFSMVRQLHHLANATSTCTQTSEQCDQTVRSDITSRIQIIAMAESLLLDLLCCLLLTGLASATLQAEGKAWTTNVLSSTPSHCSAHFSETLENANQRSISAQAEAWLPNTIWLTQVCPAVQRVSCTESDRFRYLIFAGPYQRRTKPHKPRLCKAQCHVHFERT